MTKVKHPDTWKYCLGFLFGVLFTLLTRKVPLPTYTDVYQPVAHGRYLVNGEGKGYHDIDDNRGCK